MLYTIAKVMLFAASAVAFIYGAKQYFKKRVPLFNQIVVSAMGCIMLGRLFPLLYMLLWKQPLTGFNVSMFGSFGGFLFLFSAGYGQMDGLVDGKQPYLRKYRVKALFAPVVILFADILVMTTHAAPALKTALSIMMVPMMLSSYFNLKQYIIPDVEFGILDSIRSYNLCALVLCILSALELYLEAADFNTALAVCEIVISVLYLILIPLLKKGSSKWTI